MTTFLFWNLYEKPLQGIVANLAHHHEIDVLMLAECSIAPDMLLSALNQPDAPRYHYAPSPACTKIEIFTRFPAEFIPFTSKDKPRLTIRHLKLPGLIDILLVVTHLSSKLHWSEPSQSDECIVTARSVRSTEQDIGHSRTILVGDLNMNPFERGIVTATGLNGVMCRNIAARGARTVQSTQYPFFYNPMWSLFGDASLGPPGTYYRNVSEHVGYFWNMFDQVLIRPELLGRFDNNDLKILDSDGDISFLSKNGLPNKNIASDHLPILFKLNL